MSLFSPVRLGALNLKSRVVMAPMTRNRTPGQVPTALNAEYYAQRAGAGLIVTEGTTPDASGRGYIDIPGLYNRAQAEGWREVARAVHAKGGHIFVQLMHTGRISHPDFLDGAAPVAPSAIPAPGEIYTHEGMKPHGTPRALEAAEIPALIATYGRAATLAREAGLDGVEVHGANGYLPGQFLAPNANQRTDEWGGSIENRARFLLGAVDAAVAAIGADRVGVRLSPGGVFNDIQDPDAPATYAHVAAELAKRNLAYLHIFNTNPGFDVPALIRAHYKGTLILNGGYDRARAEADIASGLADLIAFGVPYLANPDLPERLAQGAALNTPDQATFYGGGAKGYTDYPALAA
ncbi:alkene reductase [Roseococcus sp. SDR]|uniref:alkene reductase n=1 Tax=Roseococcus sp. SDR TaxID=2835532 RepID=UPI001BCF9274|nr:alkene reductase [Roseococcus sp. SDR]MBS7792410.1 alkene reductase [Roseococcus sp. SDR]MBV1847724.1 alkene reductase [Roseococcus sp. SDR]